MAQTQDSTMKTREALVADVANATHVVEEFTTIRRQQFLEGNWGNWNVIKRRMNLGSEFINPTDDEEFLEVASTGERLRVLKWKVLARPPQA